MRPNLYTIVLITLSLFGVTISNNAYAIIYKAVSSGSYSSNSTWQGGVAPGYNLTDDVIEVSSGVTVTLTGDVSIAGNAGGLMVDGSLTGNTFDIYLTGGQFSGMGSIDVDSFSGDFTAGFNFSGNLTAQKMEGATIVVHQPATLTISTLHLAGKMEMSDGTLKVNNVYVHGTTGSIKTPSLIITNTGSIQSTSITSGYDLYYVDGSAETGSELLTTNAQNIYVNPGTGEKVKLNGNLTIYMGIYLQSGSLDLNNNNLTVSSGGFFGHASGGNIISNSFSEIHIIGGVTKIGQINFHPTLNTVKIFRMSMVSNGKGTVNIGSNMKVSTELKLTRGIIVADGKITLVSGATISDGNAESYVDVLNGELVQDVDANVTKTYHVGNSVDNNYTPVIVKGNSAHTPGQLGVSINNKVPSAGTTGYDLSQTKPAIKHTWILSSTSTTKDFQLTVQWGGALEVNSFNRGNCFVSQFNGTYWDSVGNAPAINIGTNEFAQTRNFTSVGLFTVLDDKYTLSVENLAKENSFGVYPNPATDVLHIVSKTNVAATVYNMNGQAVKNQNIRTGDNRVDISSLQSGMYIIKLNGEHINAINRFIKR
ncbi:MAG: T9SS type A sorting domain-containing protein [Chitinophagales bacterium]|nr:T9SS type A sorting domain-containing protein [Chitinophagaceae bacterium]MCB9066167.1 T9SS type A sorting domain-containing protein [Chitinophagales bacterium]